MLTEENIRKLEFLKSLTSGTTAAMLLSDLVAGKENEWI
jgi:hypothetical protein